MGAIAAVVNKKRQDAIEVVATMLMMLAHTRTEAFGLASPSNIIIDKKVESLQDQGMKSPIALGYVYQGIYGNEKPQPIQLDDATAVFEGRTYSSNNKMSDAQNFAKSVQPDHHEMAKTFVARTDGDFAFAIADPERLIVGRDILGARPLYYAENTNMAAFASERKALWKIGLESAASFPPGHIALVCERAFGLEKIRAFVRTRHKQTTIQDSSEELQMLLEQSIRQRSRDLKSVTIAFSGGLDSSVIAQLSANAGLDCHLVHVSLGNRAETSHAIKVAERMRLPIHVSIFDEKDVEDTLAEVLWLIEEDDLLKASIGIPVYWAATEASEMKLKVMFAGQGADELFGGYKRYVDGYLRFGKEKVRGDVFRDITTMHETNMERDYKICNACGIELNLPYVTSQIVELALRLPIEFILDYNKNTLRKLVLRKMAENLGLPPSVVQKPKKAVQYTTGVSTALKKLAKKNKTSVRDFLHGIFQEKRTESLR